MLLLVLRRVSSGIEVLACVCWYLTSHYFVFLNQVSVDSGQVGRLESHVEAFISQIIYSSRLKLVLRLLWEVVCLTVRWKSRSWTCTFILGFVWWFWMFDVDITLGVAWFLIDWRWNNSWRFCFTETLASWLNFCFSVIQWFVTFIF